MHKSAIKEWMGDFWHYRELFFFFIWRDIKIRYKQTILGALWAIIQPFFTMIVFSLFFGRLAKMPSDGIPYPIFTYSALVPWTYFSVALSLTGNSLVSNSRLLTKVYFPRITIPAAATLSGLVDFGIASLVLIAMMAYYGIGLSWGLLLWPLLVIPLSMLALGTGMVVAALNVRYRDVKYTLPFVIQLWLFVTPIIYPTSIIPDRFRFLMALNPVGGIIEAFRASLLPERSVDWNSLGLSVSLSVLVFFIGLIYFSKFEKNFADII